MRVLLHTHSFYPHWGGTESYVLSLAKYLSRENISAAVYTYGQGPNLFSSGPTTKIYRNKFMAGETNNGSVYHLRLGFRQIADLYYLNSLKKEFDIIHIQGLTKGFEPSVCGREIGVRFKGWTQLNGKPLVITFHEQITNNNIKKYAEESKCCNAIVCNNRSSTQLLSEFIGRKVFYLPNGVDLELFNPDLSKEDVRPEPFTVLCPSRIDKAKGFLDILGAANILIKTNRIRDIQFILVNGSSYSPGFQDSAFILQLQEKIRVLGLECNFKFINGRPYSSMPELFSQSDVVLLPSYSEGFGLVIIEAMAMRKPVIATGINDIPRIISHGHDGLIIPPHDPESLAHSVKLLFDDSRMRHNLGRTGRKKVEKDYNQKIIFNRINEIYQTLVA
jgi:glycosyltransferase involved in cell wall biosynthesis